jgi:hypothetical protein
VTDTGTFGVSGSDTTAGARAVAGLARTFTNVVGYSAGGNQVNQLTINAEPVLNAPEVYNAYLEFLKDPAHLAETNTPPPPDAALIVRCRDRDCCDPDCAPCRCKKKVYYWVPCDYRADFFKLSLHVVAVRGQPTATSPNFDVTVKGLKDIKKLKVEGAYEVTLVLDKGIPRDIGYMITTIKGRVVEGPAHLQIAPPPPPSGKPAPAASPATTEEVVLAFNVITLAKAISVDKLTFEDVAGGLVEKRVAIRLEHFFPSGSPTDRLLEDIRYQLELNRLGQFQLSH